MEEQCLDGGISYNSPVLRLIVEAEEAFPDLKRTIPNLKPHLNCILSIRGVLYVAIFEEYIYTRLIFASVVRNLVHRNVPHSSSPTFTACGKILLTWKKPYSQK